MQIYGINDKIERNLVNKLTKQDILSFIKKGYSFNDEVLSKVGLKKSIRDVKYTTVIVEHEQCNKVYEKDTMRLGNIIKSLHTIDNLGDYDDSQFTQTEQTMTDEDLIEQM